MTQLDYRSITTDRAADLAALEHLCYPTVDPDDLYDEQGFHELAVRFPDGCFMVLDGELTIEMQDGEDVPLRAGEIFVVPAGAVHRPVAAEECHILLLEPAGVANTGDADTDRTADSDVWI